MLSHKQKRAALKKNIEHARGMARRLRAEGVDGITLTHYADEESFRAMKLPEEGDDFNVRHPEDVIRELIAQLPVSGVGAGSGRSDAAGRRGSAPLWPNG